jgi:hypothetical protein
MSNAVSTTGITIGYADLEAGPYTPIGELVSLTPPGFSRNKIETSTHNDGAESYILGILRQKDPQFRINFVGSDTTHQSIVADILANTKKWWQVEFPSGATLTGEARVKMFEFVDAPVDAAQQADCGLAWAGPITFDDGVV